MSIVKPSYYVKAGTLLLLLYTTILNQAQYSFYYKKLFCPKDTVIVEKKECLDDIHIVDAANIIQVACLQKLDLLSPTTSTSTNPATSISTSPDKTANNILYTLLTKLGIF